MLLNRVFKQRECVEWKFKYETSQGSLHLPLVSLQSDNVCHKASSVLKNVKMLLYFSPGGVFCFCFIFIYLFFCHINPFAPWAILFSRLLQAASSSKTNQRHSQEHFGRTQPCRRCDETRVNIMAVKLWWITKWIRIASLSPTTRPLR